MHKVPMREARAELSKLVDAAGRGDRVTITRPGRLAALLVSVEDAARPRPEPTPDPAEHLMGIPSAPDIDHDGSPLREVGFGS